MPQLTIEKQIKELDKWVENTKAIELNGRWHNELRVLVKASVKAGYNKKK